MASVAAGVEVPSVSAGRVFERAFATVRHNPVVTLGLALIFGAIPGSMSAYFISLVRVDAAANASPVFGWGLFAVGLLSIILGLVIGALVQAVLTRATVAESEGRKAGFGECVRAALAVLIPLIALSLLLAIGVGLGMVLLIVPGVILYLAWSVAAPALVEERVGVFGAFARSSALTKGSRWKIFGIMMVLGIVYYLVSLVAGLVGFSGGDGNIGQWTTRFIIVSALMGTVVNVFWGAVQASLFIELRDAKDGPAAHNLEDVFS